MSGNLIYDASGNMIGNKIGTKRQYVYSYDYRNRLVQIEKNIYTNNDTTPTEIQKIV
jgi:hypothetical protein